MPPSDAPALLVLLVAVLPGSLYTWAFERQASAYGVTLADRVLRFVGVSVAFHLLLAWPAYGVWRAAFSGRAFGAGEFAVAWLGLAVTFCVPTLAGSVVGGLHATRWTREGWATVRRVLPPGVERRLLDVLVGPGAEPRALERAFGRGPVAFVRIRTTDGDWIGGKFGAESMVGRFPHEGDIWLERAWEMTLDGLLGDRPLPYRVYVPAHQVAWIDLYDDKEDTE